MRSVESLTPQVMLLPEPEMQENYEEIYEDKFDSMSDEHEDHRINNNGK